METRFESTSVSMYLQHYGLRSKPFALDHNPSFFYPAAHQDAQDDLCYSIEERQGIATLVGEPGTGKTTLLKNLMRSFTSEMHGVLVSDTSASPGSLLRAVASELRLGIPDDQSLAMILRQQFLSFIERGYVVVVLVDEAQDLTDPQLHEVRFLSNLEYENQNLVQLILAGQPSLDARLDRPQFEALRQRVAVRTSIKSLTPGHTQRYIEMRFRVAGASDEHLFTPSALVRIHELTRGIPRLINLLCDRALIWGYAEDAHFLDEAAVEEAWSELRIEKTPEQPEPARSSFPLEPRLSAIERKVDVIIEALQRAGFLEDHATEPFTTDDAETDRSQDSDREIGRVADFPPRKPRSR